MVEVDLNEVLRWNGTKWSVVPTPAPGGSLSSDINELFEVGCTPASLTGGGFTHEPWR
ncbi:MAG TPA: hypothetical protein VFJ07_01680 [Streptosporangiaceae bacterium]|nr:hypothetical protein [Streptosporangiaceae bacterium]